jgi:hypothetical protein
LLMHLATPVRNWETTPNPNEVDSMATKRPPRRSGMRTKRPIAGTYNPSTGQWEKMGVGEARAISGELGIAFHLGQDGVVFFEVAGSHPPTGSVRPGVKGAHRFNAAGFDGVAYNPKTGEILLYDNKAWKKKSVGDATALKENLGKNLDNLIERLERTVKADPLSPPGMHAKNALKELKKAQKALKTGGKWPEKVGLAITNFGGQVEKVAKDLGIKKFVDYREMKRMRRAANVPKDLKPIIRQLEKQLDKWEPEAAEKLSAKFSKRVSRRVVQAVKQHAEMFLEKKLPKIITKFVMKESTKKTIARGASLVPLVGWVFDFEDIGHAVEDISRGHIARGLTGAGLSIVDMASDFVHVGDVVSGVGGTALSLGIQGGLIVGQVAIEIDRFQDKMKELQDEIQDKGDLPSPERLKGYYGLDDEDIADMQKQYAEPPDVDRPIEIPPFPPDDPTPPPPVDFDLDEESDGDSPDAGYPTPPPPLKPGQPPKRMPGPQPNPTAPPGWEKQPIC